MVVAKEYFASDVFPRIQPVCGPSCHDGSSPATPFIGPTADLSYQLIENRVGLIAAPTKSPLVNWIHSDPKLKSLPGPGELSVLRQWLQKETNARGLEGSVAALKSVQEAYARFGDCMNFELFTRSGMADLANVQTDRDGPCLGCHLGGQGGAYLNAEPRLTFTQLSQFPFVQKLVVAKVDSNGNFLDLIPSNRMIDKANELCEGPTCHPRYGLPPWALTAVTEFVGKTLENLKQGTCDVIPEEPLPVVDGGTD